MLRVLIVDDDPIVTSSLQTIIEVRSAAQGSLPIEVVATGHSGKEAIALYRAHKPDLALLDIRMEGMSGLEAGEIIMREDSQAKILYLTTFLDEAYIVDALRLGAKGYLMKANVEAILPAIEAINKGQCVYGDEIVERIPRLFSSDHKTEAEKNTHGLREQSVFCELSDSEWAITQGVALGKNNKEIAQELHFSEGTVRNYLSTILSKLDLRDRTQLAILYYKEGFMP